MSESIEQLEERKRRLELEREIARLERTKSASAFASRIPKWLAIPFAILGILMLAAATDTYQPGGLIIFGVLCLLPLAMRLAFYRTSKDGGQ